MGAVALEYPLGRVERKSKGLFAGVPSFEHNPINK